MAKKSDTDPIIEELKKTLATGNVIYGAERTIDALRKGNLAKVYVASNYPADKKQDIEHYAGMTGTEIVNLSMPNDELGVICRKQFSIAVLSVPK